MVSASSDKSVIEIDRTAFKDENKTKRFIDINYHADDTPESRTADGYRTHLEHLNNV